jgi:hypothetical protein
VNEMVRLRDEAGGGFWMDFGQMLGGCRLGKYCLRPPHPGPPAPAPTPAASAQPHRPRLLPALWPLPHPEAGSQRQAPGKCPGAGSESLEPCLGGSRKGAAAHPAHVPLGVPHRAKTGAKVTSGSCRPWRTTTQPRCLHLSPAKGWCPRSWTPRASLRECSCPRAGMAEVELGCD